MTTEEEEALDRLLFYLENGTGFWFGMVVGDDARPRARLCAAAEAWCKDHGQPFTLHEPEPDGLVKLAIELTKGDSPGVHWIRVDGLKGVIEAWNAGAAEMLMAMNERREAYRKRLEGGIVVEGRSTLKRILREMAPDMFSIRSFIAEPGEEPKARTSDFPEWRPPISLTSFSGIAPDTELALQRLARLAVPAAAGTPPEWWEAKVVAVTSLIGAGRYDEAESHARELLARTERDVAGRDDADKAQRAINSAHGLLAVILGAKGDMQAALPHIDRATKMFEAFGPDEHDEHDALDYPLLVSWKLQASALVASGQLDAARAVLERHVNALARAGTSTLHPEWRLELLDSLYALGYVLRELDDRTAAEQFLGKAVQVAESYALQDPDEPRWQLEIIRSRLRVGLLLMQGGDVAKGANVLEPAIERAERLESAYPSDPSWASDVQPLYVLLTLCNLEQNDFSPEALRIQDRAYAHLRNEFLQKPEDTDLGWMFGHLCMYRAALLETAGDMEGAQEAARQALDLASRLSVENEQHAQLKSATERLRAFVRKPKAKRRRPKR